LELTNDGLEIFAWKAMKNNIEIFGFNPLSLLRLIVMAEQYRENWK
jgi:hypothetical protein